MKHFLILISCLLLSSMVFSQETTNEDKPKHHEIKANAFNLIIFKSVDFSYEYLIDSESSVGLDLLFNLQDNDDIDDIGAYYNEKMAITPFYRRYFSSKYAWGFFIEAFAMYNVQDDYDGYYVYDDNTGYGNYVYTEDSSNNFAVGMSVGGKFVSRKGFAFEFYGGVGRNLTTSNNDIGTELVPRLGVNFGYRF